MASMIHLPANPGISGWSGILSPRQANKQLDENLNADYLVIGAGFAGLSAARRLNQLQPDAKIVVLEACEAVSYTHLTLPTIYSV